MDGRTVRGIRRCTGAWGLVAGVGVDRRGMASTVDILRPIRCIRRRHSGLRII